MIDPQWLSDTVAAFAAAGVKMRFYARLVHPDGSVSEYAHSTAAAGAEAFADAKRDKAVAAGGTKAFLVCRLTPDVVTVLRGKGIKRVAKRALEVLPSATHDAAEAEFDADGGVEDTDTDAK